MPRTILDDPYISFGREVCGDLSAALSREWLVTNGLGGYASGTLAGVSTRSYHGLLVGALDSPANRIVLVGGSVEQATYAGRRVPISTNEYADGVFNPDGHRHLAGFRLEGMLPVWTYAVADALIERRLWMAHGRNTTYVSYHLLHAGGPVDLDITPLITYRDHHILTSGQGWQMQVERHPQGVLDKAFEGAAPLRLLSDTGEFRSSGRWYWNFRYRDEALRGFRAHGDLYAPGSFTKRLEPGETLTLTFSVEAEVDLDGARSLAEEQARQRALLDLASASEASSPVQQLVLAADQFIVQRSGPEPEPVVIAGYHWFAEHGRATLTALPGLALATGRPEIAAGVLRAYAAHLRNGLLPNRFPDATTTTPIYNAADVSLIYVYAVDAYVRATGDESLLDDLLPSLVGIIDAFSNGTELGIGVDPEDGLLCAGSPELAVTWMNAQIDDWVITPRAGKAVELNALWHNALRVVATALTARKDKRGAELAKQADRARASFLARFVPNRGGSLADVIDGPSGDDWSLRPNQLLALALPYPILDGEAALSALEAVERGLITTHGLRTLAADEIGYGGSYAGDRAQRDAAYHQGSAWMWLIGAYADAVLAVTGDRDRLIRLLDLFAPHLRDAGLGTVSEIAEGDAPHGPRGAIAHAPAVGELLRIYRKLT